MNEKIKTLRQLLHWVRDTSNMFDSDERIAMALLDLVRNIDEQEIIQSHRYYKGQKLLCIKNFYMNDGELAYRKGTTYVITKVNDEMVVLPDEEGEHFMPFEDLDEYFDII